MILGKSGILFSLILLGAFVPATSALHHIPDYQHELDSLSELYKNEEDDSIKIRILLNTVIYYDLHKIDTAIYIAKLGEELAAKTGDTLALARAKTELARFSSIQSNFSLALKYDLEALNLFRKTNNRLGEIQALNDIGEDYYDQDLFSDAFNYYNQSLEKAEKAGDTLSIAISTYNIGRVLKSMGQFKNAIDYINNSMEISKQIGDLAGIAYSLYDLSEILIENKNYVEGLEKLSMSLKYCDSLLIDDLRPQVLNRIGDVYREQNDSDKSLEYYDAALNIYQKVSNQRGIGESYFGKGQTYLLKKDYVRALSLFNQTLEISQRINDSELRIQSYKCLSRVYEMQGKLPQALSFYKKYKETQDSLFSQKTSGQFAQMQTQYQVAKKDLEIELLNQNEVRQNAEIKNQEMIRNIFVVLLAVTVILFANLYRSSERRKKNNAILLQQQQELRRQRKELESLLSMKDKFFSIISHDLRSPLSALAGIIDIMQEGQITQKELKEVTKSLKTRLDSTNKLLDNLLDWAMLQMDEINPQYSDLNLKQLIDENIEFFNQVNEKNIQFVNALGNTPHVTVDKNMLDLVIRNLVSNAVKFTEKNGEVQISADQDERLVIVEIRDNGVGMSQEQANNIFDTESLYTTRGTANEKGTGLGLRLCKEFVEKMGGKIWVESKKGEGSIFKFTVRKA